MGGDAVRKYGRWQEVAVFLIVMLASVGVGKQGKKDYREFREKNERFDTR